VRRGFSCSTSRWRRWTKSASGNLPFLERVRSSLSIPTIFVSHNIDEVVQLANRVAVIAQGRVRRLGSIFEVFADLGSATFSTPVRWRRNSVQGRGRR